MSELSDLYQEVILDHNKRPRNFRHPEGTNQEAEGYNPLCGDHISLFLRLNDDVIEDIGFQGSGCAVSKASASMMTEALKGKSLDQAQTLFERFRALVTGADGGGATSSGSPTGSRDGSPGVDGEKAASHPSHSGKPGPQGPGSTASERSASSGETGPSAVAIPLGKLAVFAGVSEFPMRVKCATLAWHTMKAALEGKKEAVSTE